MNKGIVVFVMAFLSLSAGFGQEWQTDFTKAKEKATAEDKPIILVFQGSDWCAPCKNLTVKFGVQRFLKTMQRSIM